MLVRRPSSAMTTLLPLLALLSFADAGMALGDIRRNLDLVRASGGDPLLRAAKEGDLARLSVLLEAYGEGSMGYATRATQALRAALQGVRLDDRADVLGAVAYLLAHQANPNDRSNGQPSVLFDADEDDEELQRLLKKAGATLTPTERVFAAIRRHRCEDLPALLNHPQVDFKRSTPRRWLSIVGNHPLAYAMHHFEYPVDAARPLVRQAPYSCVWPLLRSPKVSRTIPSRSFLELFVGHPILLAAVLQDGAPVKDEVDLCAVLEGWRRVHQAPSDEERARAGVLLKAITSYTGRRQLLGACQSSLQLAVRALDGEAVDVLRRAGVQLDSGLASRIDVILDDRRRPGPLEPDELRSIELLLRAGAKADTQWRDTTPVTWAAEHGDRALMTLLLDASASPGWGPSYGCTPIAIAAAHDDVEMVRLLLARGADPKATFLPSERCGLPPSRERVSLLALPLSEPMKRLLGAQPAP